MKTDEWFRKDRWVVVTRFGTHFAGRVGLIQNITFKNYAYIQFGTDGPFHEYNIKSLRPATNEEIPKGVL